MTGLLLTGTSSFNSINQLKVISIALDKTVKNWDFSYLTAKAFLVVFIGSASSRLLMQGSPCH